jgi:hypothetical protein
MLKAEEVALFAAVREKLYSAAIGDILDSMGLHRNFLPARIRPLTPDMIVVGKAAPVVVADGIGTGTGPPALLERWTFRGRCLHHERFHQYALWGELLHPGDHLRPPAAAMNSYTATPPEFSARILTLWGAWAQDIR